MHALPLFIAVLIWSSSADICSTFTRCSSCVFNAAAAFAGPTPICSWCQSSQTCSASQSVGACADIRNQTFHPSCPDMTCVASRTTNNVYFCRGSNIAALIFAIFLLILSGMFYLWLRAIWQMPWRYSNINAIVDEHMARLQSFHEWRQVIANVKGPVQTEMVLKSRAEHSRTGSSCPMCKVLQADVLGPGQVCFISLAEFLIQNYSCNR